MKDLSFVFSFKQEIFSCDFSLIILTINHTVLDTKEVNFKAEVVYIFTDGHEYCSMVE